MSCPLILISFYLYLETHAFNFKQNSIDFPVEVCSPTFGKALDTIYGGSGIKHHKFLISLNILQIFTLKIRLL